MAEEPSGIDLSDMGCEVILMIIAGLLLSLFFGIDACSFVTDSY
tara:strand:+ start:1604 stop:1735 length:132 start_codon:yes stop_codon:yes gene_type:complete